MNTDRLEQALTKAFRMGAASIHCPDIAERIRTDFAGFVLDEVAALAAIPAPEGADALVEELRSWRDSGMPPRSTEELCDRAADEIAALRAAPAPQSHDLTDQDFRVFWSRWFETNPTQYEIDFMRGIANGAVKRAAPQTKEPKEPKA